MEFVMFDTEYGSVAERKNQHEIFTHRAVAHERGFYQAWELRGLQASQVSRLAPHRDYGVRCRQNQGALLLGLVLEKASKNVYLVALRWRQP
mgnify:CR=1 FL=1